MVEETKKSSERAKLLTLNTMSGDRSKRILEWSSSGWVHFYRILNRFLDLASNLDITISKRRNRKKEDDKEDFSL